MKTKDIKSYTDLIVWQKSMELVGLVYELTGNFPDSERYGLTSQVRRCVVSMPSNIAEGRMYGTRKHYRHFLIRAYGSGAELETQIAIAKRLSFGQKQDYAKVGKLLNEIMKMLNKMIGTLNS